MTTSQVLCHYLRFHKFYIVVLCLMAVLYLYSRDRAVFFCLHMSSFHKIWATFSYMNGGNCNVDHGSCTEYALLFIFLFITSSLIFNIFWICPTNIFFIFLFITSSLISDIYWICPTNIFFIFSFITSSLNPTLFGFVLQIYFLCFLQAMYTRISKPQNKACPCSCCCSNNS